MTGTPTRYEADWVLPVSGPPVPGGAVLVSPGGEIMAVGRGDQVSRADPDATAVPLGAAAICPGLVNAHAHPDLGALRGALEDLPFPEWIRGIIRAHGVLGDAELAVAARLGVLEMARAGITAFGATEQTGASVRVAAEVGLRAVVYLEVFGPDPVVAEDAVTDLSRRVQRSRAEAGPLVRIGVSPHAPYSVSDDLYAGVAAYAAGERLPVAVHIAESREETELVRDGTGSFAERLAGRGIAVSSRGRSPIDLLERTGVLGLAPLLVHCVQVDEEDVRALVAAGATVAHCPVANARLGHGAAPLRALLERGAPVGLGTDSVAANNRIDLLEEARTASLLYRVTGGDPAGLPAAEALRLATLGGARCLGLETEVGTLEPGKRADLCVVSLEAPHVRPVHDPCAAVVHAARGSDVRMTVVEGRVVWDREGGTEDPDLAAALEAAAGRVRVALAGASVG